MSYDRHERRRERLEGKLARETERRDNTLASTSSLVGLSGPELEAQLRRRIEARIRARNAFYVHLIVYLGVNALLWVIYFLTDAGDIPWPLFVAIPWGIPVLIQGLAVYRNTLSAVERREQNIRREIELEKQRLGLVGDPGDDAYEKPKRDRVMRLSDDGEMVPADDEDEAPLSKAKHG